MVESVKKHWYVVTLMACLCCLAIGTGLALIIGRTLPQAPYFIVFGGNQDPGDGNGGGLARQQMIDGGWTDDAHSFQVTWNAHIESGTKTDTSTAMPAGHDAYNQHCKSGNRCVIAGFSLGTMPALRLAAEVGLKPADNYIFGGPQPSTGIWHDQYTDNPFVEPGLQEFGQFDTNQFVPAGTQVFYDTRDPYDNAAPQCTIPYALSLEGHYVISKAQADGSHVWTGTDGAVMHEANYVGQPNLPLSGSDPSPVWAGCELNDWHKTPSNTFGGAPSIPGIPTAIPTP